MDVLAGWRGVLGQPTVEPGQGVTTTRVVAEDGRRYVLKRVEGLRDLGERRYRLVSEYRVLLHLWQAGLPVVLPVLDDTGRLYAEAPGADDAIYTLQPELRSTADAGTPLHPLPVYWKIGAMIGRLHRSLAEYPHAFPSWTIDLVPRTFDEAVRDLSRLPERERTPVLEVVATRREDMTCAMTGLPAQRIHGDCHGGNILVADGEVCGLIDLDHLPIGPRMYDLAYFLANQLAWPDAAALSERAVELRAIARNLIGGYQSVAELSQPERSAIGPVTLAVQLQLIGWNAGRPGGPYVREHLNGFHWLAAEDLEELGAGGHRPAGQ